MIENLRRKLARRSPQEQAPGIDRPVLAAALCIAGIAVILWSAWMDRLNPCPAGECTLLGNPGCQPLGEFLTFLFIALGFWFCSILAWLAARRIRAFALFLLIANALSLGMLGGTGVDSDLPARLFYILLAWAVPLIIQFHHFLLERPARRTGKLLMASLYALAVALSLPFLLLPITTLEDWGWFAPLRLSLRLGVAAAWTLGILLLVREYKSAPPAVRRRVRLVTFGTGIAAAPFVLLSLLPDTMGVEPHVPFEVTIPFLLLSPLAYVYALLRRRLPRTELALDRAGVYYLLVLFLLCFYLMAATLLTRMATDWPSPALLVSGSLSILLLALFAPLKRGFERFLHWVLFGGEITYASVVGRIADSLATTLDCHALLELLMKDLPAALRLDKVGLFLKGDDNMPTMAGSIGFPPSQAARQVPSDRALATFLMTGSVAHASSDSARTRSTRRLFRERHPRSEVPVRDIHLQRALADAALGEEERALLSIKGLAYWVPLVSGDALQGLLLVGPRCTEEPFSAEDERILETLSRQAGIAIHNVRLMDQLTTSRQELAAAHRQMLTRIERERR